jgi:uncharacterized protein
MHCAAMCGGFVAAIAAREAHADGRAPLFPARVIAKRQIAYHAGRLTTYASLGALAGVGGSFALQAADALSLQRPLYLFANVLLLLIAMSVVLNASGGLAWQRVGARLFASAMPALQPLLRRQGMRGRILLGLAWGFVPCGLVYSVLPLALFAGGPGQGAIVMLAFGLGTLPWLAATGFIFNRVAPRLRASGSRYVIAGLITAFAVLGMYRALLAPETLGAGPFCLLP